jgi:hypothetical protein
MTDTPETFDDEDRRLCPDDACIGLLDETGHCKVCGRSADGTAGIPHPHPHPHDDEPEDEMLAAPMSVEDGDDDRRLCPDGTCIGLLDETGHCKVCGAAGP